MRELRLLIICELFYFPPNQKLGHIFPYSGAFIELKFIDGISRTFFSLGILNDEA